MLKPLGNYISTKQRKVEYKLRVVNTPCIPCIPTTRSQSTCCIRSCIPPVYRCILGKIPCIPPVHPPVYLYTIHKTSNFDLCYHNLYTPIVVSLYTCIPNPQSMLCICHTANSMWHAINIAFPTISMPYNATTYLRGWQPSSWAPRGAAYRQGGF